MILPCTGCTDYRSPAVSYQDKRYGKGRRVHTPLKNGDYTCTVCERKRSGPKAKRVFKMED